MDGRIKSFGDVVYYWNRISSFSGSYCISLHRFLEDYADVLMVYSSYSFGYEQLASDFIR